MVVATRMVQDIQKPGSGVADASLGVVDAPPRNCSFLTTLYIAAYAHPHRCRGVADGPCGVSDARCNVSFPVLFISHPQLISFAPNAL
ncbi:hypothetical protein Hanom_Chr10g00895481 [Helianthus anomalus]